MRRPPSRRFLANASDGGFRDLALVAARSFKASASVSGLFLGVSFENCSITGGSELGGGSLLGACAMSVPEGL
jgi:hypothetical protein